MRKALVIAVALAAAPLNVSAAAGDLDVTYNVWTKHFKTSTYYRVDSGINKYYENNDFKGVRYGVTDNINVGMHHGDNSFGRSSTIAGVELVSDFNQYVQPGVMLAGATGYDEVSDNGFMAVAGPMVRFRTPYLGATFAVYNMTAFVLTVDVPISTSLR